VEEFLLYERRQQQEGVHRPVEVSFACSMPVVGEGSDTGERRRAMTLSILQLGSVNLEIRL
jgi:hypothetical protein